eukprot:COSAG04_NODE_360_length_15920_cov_50.432815_12_plen_139_part_00
MARPAALAAVALLAAAPTIAQAQCDTGRDGREYDRPGGGCGDCYLECAPGQHCLQHVRADGRVGCINCTAGTRDSTPDFPIDSCVDCDPGQTSSPGATACFDEPVRTKSPNRCQRHLAFWLHSCFLRRCRILRAGSAG